MIVYVDTGCVAKKKYEVLLLYRFKHFVFTFMHLGRLLPPCPSTSSVNITVPKYIEYVDLSIEDELIISWSVVTTVPKYSVGFYHRAQVY